ncbi:hypothetical protein CEK71_21145 [Methylovulum psychrotolerans]|uniref:Uncharacterized protein n=1 Tax=Methylovulum psychrotolerans TaxID=1704499 RepID=A0A1Z4C4G4_9GAMM|nr:hypothetical protein CEK71_21145 [Methylovulum psychrotolerans]
MATRDLFHLPETVTRDLFHLEKCDPRPIPPATRDLFHLEKALTRDLFHLPFFLFIKLIHRLRYFAR